MHHKFLILAFVMTLRLAAQDAAGSPVPTKQILDRLDTLEKENRELMLEVKALRQAVETGKGSAAPAVSSANEGTSNQNAAQQAPLEERVAVEERRTAEQAQTKVEAAHKFPVQLNGMLLFNAFSNSENYTAGSPVYYGVLTGPNSSGATVRQTLLGFDFQGPSLPGNGRVNGSLTMDFFGGYPDPEASRVRLRQAYVSLDWQNRSFSVGQQKPLISPYQPDSLAEVGIPPLSGAGNLWLWLPQARYEERIHFSSNTGLTAQAAVLQTNDNYAYVPPQFANSLEQARPALEGRFAFWHKFDDTRRFEIAPGFHVGTSHVAGGSAGSHIGSLDWLVVPSSYFRLTGTFFKGQNVAGLGSLGNGFVVLPDGQVKAVDSSGGWAQMSIPLTSRFTLNAFGGLEADHSPFLNATSSVRNWNYASNIMYRLGANVLVGVEAMQIRTRLLSGSTGVQNHYDLALGYLF